ELSDNDACLEWLKNQRYPHGVECPVCKKVTKHSKVLGRSCFVCNNCGHQVSPTAETIFHKSHISLKTWFAILRRMSDVNSRLSAKDVQREYGVTYVTAWRMVNRIKEFLGKNKIKTSSRKNGGI